MVIFLILSAIVLGLHVPSSLPVPSLRSRRERSAAVGGLFFVGAGALHFIAPAGYLPMMPPILPGPLLLIYVSGAAEVLGGFGLLVPPARRWAAWGLLALLVTVFPANVYVAYAGIPLDAFPETPRWAYWVRLPFQAVLMAWVAWVGGIWPRIVSHKR